MRLDFNSIIFKSWLQFMVFAIFIFVLLWVLQYVFLNTYYNTMKANEIDRLGREIVNSYNSSEYTERILEDYARKNNLTISLYDSLGEIVFTVDAYNNYQMSLNIAGTQHAYSEAQFDELKNQLSMQELETIHYTKPEANGITFYYGAVLRNSGRTPQYLLVASPLPAFDSVMLVLKNLLMMITVILFVISLSMAQLFSHFLSVPLINLTRSAQELAAGKLDVRFNEQEGYTEIHQLASTLNYATTELSRADEYRKDFIANISHDLKTPLTIIKFYAEMISDISGSDPVKRAAHCDLIMRETDRLTKLVTEILELSKLQSSSVSFTPAPVNLSECLQETMTVFEALGEQEGYVFHVRIDQNLQVNADEPMLRRVFDNLIGNAVHYTGENKSITVNLQKTDKNCVRFEVKDTGKGISSEKQKGIWERYYKGTPELKRTVVGTGLGLAIVKNILTTHKAAYGVNSVVNKGSTFWFELPLLTLAAPEAPPSS